MKHICNLCTVVRESGWVSTIHFKTKKQLTEHMKEIHGKKNRKKPKRAKIPEEIKAFVMKRDKKRCCDCGCEKNVHIHHKVHVEHGGTNDSDNLEVLCDLCHAERHRGENVYNIMIQCFWEYETIDRLA